MPKICCCACGPLAGPGHSYMNGFPISKTFVYTRSSYNRCGVNPNIQLKYLFRAAYFPTGKPLIYEWPGPARGPQT